MSWEFDPDIAMNKIGDMLEDMVGEQLSFLPNPDGTDSTQRSIIIGYTDGVEPPLPFIVLRFEGSEDNNGFLLDREIIEIENPLDPDNPSYAEVYKKLLNYSLTVRCEGEGSYNILSKISKSLSLSSYTDPLKESIFSTVNLIHPIRYAPDLLSDQYRSINDFVLSMSTVDTLTDTAAGVIDTITHTGNIKTSEEDSTGTTTTKTLTSL